MVKVSSALAGAFVVLPVLMAVLLLIGLRRSVRVSPGSGDRSGGKAGAVRAAAIAVVWLVLTAAAARAGRLTFATVPPTIVVAIVVSLVLAVVLSVSGTGGRLAASVPLAALVGTQAFRFPLELAMHRASEAGLMPVQMSYTGLNFDIVTGITAAILAIVLLIRRVSPIWVHVWNAMGFVLLLNIIVIAVLSSPLPIRVFMNEPANVWIQSFPFVWLPTVLVPAALAGHILVWRRLSLERRAGSRATAR